MRIQYMISFIPNWRLYNLLLFASLPHRQMVSWECVLNTRFVCALVDRSSGQKKTPQARRLEGLAGEAILWIYLTGLRNG
jgi:hypothetical protein